MNAFDPRFPLGNPLNQVAEPTLRPIPRRPNWFVDSVGIERYVEPTRERSFADLLRACRHDKNRRDLSP